MGASRTVAAGVVMTSKRIIVLRHAKSDQHGDAPTDHDRPLNARGLRSAPLVAARLVELGWSPQAVISSDAARTRQTWDAMRESFGGAPTVTFTRELYLAGPQQAESALRKLPDEVHTAMIIGHNPGWEDVVQDLCGVSVRMTTCNAALLHRPSKTWREALADPRWEFEAVVRPKEL